MQYTHKRRYKLAGKSVSTINFSGASANYFRIVNGSPCELYAGTVQTPTAVLYDFRIPAHSAKMYCEQRPYKSIQIFNNSTDEAEILLFAFNAPFEASALAIADFMEGEGEKKTFNVEIGGFTQSLPTGKNNIGSVSIEASHLEEITRYNYCLQDIYTRLAKDAQKFNNFYETTATATGQTYTAGNGFQYCEIAFCSNDGESDIALMTIDSDGTEKSITLKAGEVMNHIPCCCKSIKITGDCAYRLCIIELGD